MTLNGFAEFSQNMDWAGLTDFLLTGLAVLVCLTVHEVSHGLAAYGLGDPTAKSHNRLSFNPLRHLDPFGTLMMLVAGFGWARPVPVDMRYFKRPKLGMAVTALAGPASNLVLAYGALLLYAGLLPLYISGQGAGLQVLLHFLLTLASLSIGLGIFNLIPIPPLDGSKILEGILPDRMYYTILRYERFGMIALMILLWSGVADRPLWAVRSWVMNGMIQGSEWLFNLVYAVI